MRLFTDQRTATIFVFAAAGAIIAGAIGSFMLGVATEAAVWGQAIGSLIIIGVTAWIANRQSREAKARELATLQQFQMSVANIALACLKSYKGLLKAANNRTDGSVPSWRVCSRPLRAGGDSDPSGR